MFAVSANTPVSLRRKPKSFRDKSRRLTANLTNFFKVSRKSVKVDFTDDTLNETDFFELPYCPIPVVFGTLQPVRSAPQISTSHPPDFGTYIDKLRDEDIRQILKHFSAKDLLQLRFLGKKFNRVIQDHALEFMKVQKDSLKICQLKDADDVTLKLLGGSSEPLKLETLDRALRHVTAKAVTFSNLTVTGPVIRYLHRSIKYEIMELKFIECEFLIKARELAIMVNEWKPKFIQFIDCKRVPQCMESIRSGFIDDYFFSTMREPFDSLHFTFSNNASEERLNITDKFQFFFKTTKTIPSTINFGNCLTDITSNTLQIAIEAYIQAAKNHNLPKTSSFQWHFGRIQESREQILAALSVFDKAVVRTRHISEHSCTYVFKVSNSLPLLSLTIGFKQVCMPRIQNRHSKEKIIWKETHNFDFPEDFL